MADETSTATATPGAAPERPAGSDRPFTERPDRPERPAGERPDRPAGGPGGRPPGRGPGGPGGPGGRKFFRRKKVCKFCVEKIDSIHYRDVRLLQQFVAERGKIVPRRLTGVCTTHQRRLTRAIKQARNIALLPFAARY
jgi:small subunit ribosomal protein S18